MDILFAEIDRSHSGDTEKDSCFRSTGLFQTKSSQLYEFEKDFGRRHPQKFLYYSSLSCYAQRFPVLALCR
jgi:hypothetical protein